MARRNVEINLDLENRDARRRVQDLAGDVGDLGTDLEDVESAGQRMARALQQSADDMIDEIDETRRAVDALDQALGPGFDADTREVVADLRSLGLTANDIEADADALAAGLRRAGDVRVHATEQGFDDLGQAVGSVRDETGRAGDTMSGFIGGTIGELPGISEAMGPVGEGLGQLAEGALSGEIGFKQLAVAGGAMAGVAFVLSRVQQRMQRISEFDNWRSDQVEAYTDALRDADTVVGAVEQKLRDADELTVSLGKGLIDLDLMPAVARAGVDVADLSELIAGGTAAVDDYREAMEAAGVPIEQYGAVILAATTEIELLAEGQEAAAVAQEFFGEVTDETTDTVDAATDAVTRLTDQQMEQVRATQRLAREWNDMQSEFSDRRGFLNAGDALAGLGTAAAEGTEITERELLDAKDAVIDYARELDSIGEREFAATILARIDEGSYADAENLLRLLERARTSTIDVRYTGDIPRGNQAPNRAGQNNRAAARGTKHTVQDRYLLGEEGPEFVEMPGGAKVTDARDTARELAGAGGTVNVYQNFPAGTRPADVVKAQRDWARRQGPL